MAQLNNSFVERLRQEFGGTRFSENDFNFSFPPKGQVLCKIVFKYNESFEFNILEVEGRDSVAQRDPISSLFGASAERREKSVAAYLVHSPGQYKSTDTLQISAIGDANEQLRNWCRYIYEEISHNGNVQPLFDELRREVEAQLDETIKDPDGSFDVEELSKIESKFDDLLSKFEALNEENKITKKELERISQDLAGFKSSAKVMRKGMWARVTNNKLVDIAVSIAKSKEGRELILSQLKKLL